MKITKSQLKQIIKEELESALKEGPTEPGMVDFKSMRAENPARYAQIKAECDKLHPDGKYLMRCLSYKATGLEYTPPEG